MGKVKFSRGTKSSDGPSMPSLGFMAGVGAHVGCDANDNSFFCQLTKFTSIISQLLFLLSIIAMMYFVYKYFIHRKIFGKK